MNIPVKFNIKVLYITITTIVKHSERNDIKYAMK